MNTKKALRGLCAIAVFATAPVQIANAATDVFEKLHEECNVPSIQAHATCRALNLGDPGNLACMIAAGNADAASAACNADVSSAQTAVILLLGFVKAGEGFSGPNCNSNLPPECIAVGIVSLYNPTFNKSASVCAAAAPGAVSTTLVCDGFPGAPGAGGAAGAQPLGNALGCVSASATFVTSNTRSAGACAQPVN